MAKLAASRVAVFGIGGVGGYVVEALARAGVGALDLIDDDVVSVTNINRQLAASSSVVGQPKAEVMAARVRDINPTCRVTVHRCFYLPATSGQIDLAQFDYVVDAVDTVTAKLHLIQNAQAAGVPIISAMGTGNKLDPSAFRVGDIFETSICPLARIMRKECRKRGISGFKTVFSTEPPLHPLGTIEQEAGPQNSERPEPGRRDTPGSISFVPAAAGLLLASEVVQDLINR